jgi:hypothetical protein
MSAKVTDDLGVPEPGLLMFLRILTEVLSALGARAQLIVLVIAVAVAVVKAAANLYLTFT